MAKVTSFTAERSLQIEQTTVVDGEVVGGELILKTRGGTDINAGSVIGPQGIPGPQGPGPIIGEIRMTILTTVPTGWLLMNGQTIVNAATAYPTLWAAAPTAWKSGSNLILPDVTRRHLVGAISAPGAVGGSDIIDLQIAHLPPHNHPASAAAAGAHSHGPSGGFQFLIGEMASSTLWLATGAAANHPGDVTFTATTDIEAAHSHTITTSNTGSGTPLEHRPQYMTVCVMIYAGP